MDPGVEEGRTHVMMLNFFEDKIGSVVAAAPLIWDPRVECRGIEDVCRLRQVGEPSTNHFWRTRLVNPNVRFDFIDSSVLASLRVRRLFSFYREARRD
jgi:hypothetical protein